jgi:hypothetical protein
VIQAYPLGASEKQLTSGQYTYEQVQQAAHDKFPSNSQE